MNKFYKRKHLSPYIKILISFAAVIVVGALLLWLPFAAAEGKAMSFIDALFMSASSVCITGLSVVPNLGASLTLFGKIVVALLVEIGGLSILTIAIFILVLLGKKVGIGDRFMLKEALNLDSVGGIVRILKALIIYVFSVQLAGVVLLLPCLMTKYDFFSALGLSIFHSIASFNNAGLDIFGFADSLAEFQTNYYFMSVTMLLIVIGSIGFVVVFDLYDFFRGSRRNLSLLTKIVLIATICLIALGALFIVISDPEIGFFNALFYSVSARTAGFATVPVEGLSNLGMTTLMILMFIGGAPCSTAGGLKTSTTFVVLFSTVSYALGRKPVIFKRRISEVSVMKSFSLLMIFILVLSLSILTISLVHSDFNLSDIIFECVSAMSNTGLSRGITTRLGIVSKLVIIFDMFIGRIGPLTIFNLWSYGRKRETEDIKYVEEKIIIG